MASGEIQVKLSHEWREEDADGQECMVCGDTCYLFPPRRLVVTCRQIDIRIESADVVCASCYDAIEVDG
jgi:hypothetical protein